MNAFEIPDHVYKAEAMTVGELRKKIKNMRSDAKVYIIADKFSDYAWDEDSDQWRYALPLAYISKEKILGDSFEDDEYNLLLEVESA